MTGTDLLNGLNAEQIEAVRHTKGPMLVVAGAGAGKTTVITRRAARLISEGVPPYRILILTFTNKAARELRERLKSMVGEAGQQVVAGTFHSFVLRHLIRKHGKHNGSASRAIIDDSESKTLFKEALESLSAQERQQRIHQGWRPQDLMAEMSLARAQGLTPDQYRQRIRPGSQDEPFQMQVSHAWREYLKLLDQRNAMDFDAILETGMDLLTRYPKVRRAMETRFAHIMVDEYQDTNPIQYGLIRVLSNLASEAPNVFAVGDARQSIYGFRGSDVGIILRFISEWCGARVVELPSNYRSSSTIVDAANRIANRMAQKIGDKDMVAAGRLADHRAPLCVEGYDTARDEAEWIAAQIKEKHNQGERDIAVLYRNRAVKGQVEQALIESGIPYVVVGDTGFLQRKEVRDLMALLRITINDRDDLAWLRLIETAKIGVSSKRIREETGMTGIPVVDVLKARAQGKGKVAARLQSLMRAVEGCETVDQVEDLWRQYLAPAIAKQVRSQHKDRTQDEREQMTRMRENNALRLLEIVRMKLKEGQSYEEIIEDLALLSDDNPDPALEGEGGEPVRLMTIHASKGLEFDHVFLPAMEEEVIPGTASDPDEMEEERRIFYVAVTRARKSVSLTHARQRMIYGKTLEVSPSRFLADLDAQPAPSLEDGPLQGWLPGADGPGL